MFPCPTLVADGVTDGVDPAAEGRVRYDPPVPDTIDQVVLRDNAVAVFDEIEEHAKNLGLDSNGIPGAVQLVSLRINQVVAESVNHHTDRAYREESRFSEGKIKETFKRRIFSQLRLPVSSDEGGSEMHDDTEIRRRPDGSIDLQHYARIGRALHGKAVSGIFRKLWSMPGKLACIWLAPSMKLRLSRDIGPFRTVAFSNNNAGDE